MGSAENYDEVLKSLENAIEKINSLPNSDEYALLHSIGRFKELILQAQALKNLYFKTKDHHLAMHSQGSDFSYNTIYAEIIARLEEIEKEILEIREYAASLILSLHPATGRNCQ